MSEKYVAPIPQAEIDGLLDTATISKKDYDDLLVKIGERFGYVMLTAMELLDRKVVWFDYANEDGEREIRGVFEPIHYHKEIEFVGEITPRNMTAPMLYEHAVPTAWLTFDFEESLKKEIEAAKVFAERKAALAKDATTKAGQRKAEIHAAIKAKLTVDELRHVRFV